MESNPEGKITGRKMLMARKERAKRASGVGRASAN